MNIPLQFPPENDGTHTATSGVQTDPHNAEAERAFIDHRLCVRGHCDNAGYFPGSDTRLQGSVYSLTVDRLGERRGDAGQVCGRNHACGCNSRRSQQRITSGDWLHLRLNASRRVIGFICVLKMRPPVINLVGLKFDEECTPMRAYSP